MRPGEGQNLLALNARLEEEKDEEVRPGVVTRRLLQQLDLSVIEVVRQG
jgi:hypothetical protein